MEAPSRQLALLRPDQVLAEMSRTPLVYLPIGPLEWHGPHLPLGTDALNAEKVAQLCAEETGGLLLPTLYWGTERERSPDLLDWLGFPKEAWIVGMDFPANTLPSMYASEEVFALLVREQLRLAAHMGFKVIAVITGHAAENQIAVLERLAAEYNAAGKVQVLVCLPFVSNTAGVMEVGHASRIETSVMLALRPETVDLASLPPAGEPLRNIDWAIVDYRTFAGMPTAGRVVPEDDDPRHATADAGRTNMRLAKEKIVAQVRQCLG